MGLADDQQSPLVLDLTGSGINLTALSYTSPYFDLTGDGFATKTGWIGSGTGLLCLDRNGDGQINSGLELFGTADGSPNGFADLAKLDANGDGAIDAHDAQFGDLRVWVDANGNGVADPGELFTLAQLGIVSINLNATAVNELIAGNSIKYTSTYTLADGTQRSIADAWFATSPTYTRPDVAVAIPSNIAALPQVNGFGSMADLQTAMVADPELAGMVQNFQALSASTDPAMVAADVGHEVGAIGVDHRDGVAAQFRGHGPEPGIGSRPRRARDNAERGASFGSGRMAIAMRSAGVENDNHFPFGRLTVTVRNSQDGHPGGRR